MRKDSTPTQPEIHVSYGPPADEKSPLVLLVTKVDGDWRFVTEQEHRAGKKAGEVWLTFDEMLADVAEGEAGSPD